MSRDPLVEAADEALALDYMAREVYTRGTLRLMMEDIGEGWSGEYDPEDPDDEPLLRFTFYTLVDGEWEFLDDGSYCTRLPASSPPEVIKAAAERIMDHVYGVSSPKRACEEASWIDASWVANAA